MVSTLNRQEYAIILYRDGLKDTLCLKGIKTDPSASAMLTEYLGTDLHKIVNELDKLIITLPEGKPVITTALIEKNIGISKDYNNFELAESYW